MYATIADGGLTVSESQGAASTFLVVNGIAGSGVSFESLAKRANFLMHEPYDTAKVEHNFLIQSL
jgi:hypothetical protein